METPIWQVLSMAWFAFSIIAETNDRLWRSGCALALLYYALPAFPPGDPLALLHLGIAFIGLALLIISFIQLMAKGASR